MYHLDPVLGTEGGANASVFAGHFHYSGLLEQLTLLRHGTKRSCLTRPIRRHTERPHVACLILVRDPLSRFVRDGKEMYTQYRALKKPPIKKLCIAFCPNKLKNLAHSTQATNHTLNKVNSVCEGAASQVKQNTVVCEPAAPRLACKTVQTGVNNLHL